MAVALWHKEAPRTPAAMASRRHCVALSIGADDIIMLRWCEQCGQDYGDQLACC